MARVTAPEIGPFPCTLLPGHWNGFARPLFTRDVGNDIIRELTSDEDVLEAYYSSAQDAFVILRKDDTEPEVFSATAGGLYDIGTDCWAWTEVPDSGCEECNWRGWAVVNRDDPAVAPHGEIQHCDNCQSLPYDDDAYPLARQAGFEVDDSGRVTKTPVSDLRRVAVLPTTSVAPLVQPAEAPGALQGITRYIRVAGGAKVPLGQYCEAIRLAIAHPNQQFNQGLTTWWPVTGAEIRRQFRASIHQRINQAIPWVLRR